MLTALVVLGVVAIVAWTVNNAYWKGYVAGYREAKGQGKVKQLTLKRHPLDEIEGNP